MHRNNFIEQSSEKYHNKYDYSLILNDILQYSSCVDIICPIHGIFKQRIKKHLSGVGCLKCYTISKWKSLFLRKANEKWGQKYSYSKMVYLNNRTEIEIIDNSSNISFFQTPKAHLDMSKNTNPIKVNDVEIIKPLDTNIDSFDIYNSGIFEYISSMYVGDIMTMHNSYHIYLPGINLAFRCVDLYRESEIFFDRKKHLDMTLSSSESGIKLIQIWQDDWENKKDIVKSIILNNIRKCNRIFARNCDIVEVVDNDLVKSFLKCNHIQGFSPSKIKIGLLHNSELICLMTFGDLRISLGQKSVKNTFELIRFCSKLNNVVVGGASKLLKYFIKKYNPCEIISYSDKFRSNGDLYKLLGFDRIHSSEPCYYYIIQQNGSLYRKHRFSFRKDKLISQGFDSKKTEKQIMLDRKIFRIYDSGTDKWVMYI